MKIVNLETFSKLPVGTVFSKWEPCVIDDLCVLTHMYDDKDFCLVALSDPCDNIDLASGESEAGFNVAYCDGRYEENQLFAIWSEEDLKGLIERLTNSLPMAADNDKKLSKLEYADNANHWVIEE